MVDSKTKSRNKNRPLLKITASTEALLGPFCTWRPVCTARWPLLGWLSFGTTPRPPCRSVAPLGPGGTCFPRCTARRHAPVLQRLSYHQAPFSIVRRWEVISRAHELQLHSTSRIRGIWRAELLEAIAHSSHLSGSGNRRWNPMRFSHFRCWDCCALLGLRGPCPPLPGRDTEPLVASEFFVSVLHLEGFAAVRDLHSNIRGCWLNNLTRYVIFIRFLLYISLGRLFHIFLGVAGRGWGVDLSSKTKAAVLYPCYVFDSLIKL